MHVSVNVAVVVEEREDQEQSMMPGFRMIQSRYVSNLVFDACKF